MFGTLRRASADALGDVGHGRGESVGPWWLHTTSEEKIMRKTTDTAEPSLDELNPGELNLGQLEAVSGGLLATMLSNIANMRHEMLKTVANNLRA